jgi:nitrite reductase/ring-hydroxylating ferredoxin subunit
MGVYLAYALILLHVFLGAFQQETSPVLLTVLILGFISIVALHVYTGLKETRFDNRKQKEESQDWQYVCELNEIEENRAKMTSCDGERIAIFKYEGKLSAVHNVCKHQNGPLGEGKIVDGCITCPWHGYQYLPANGQSPPPFHEKVATYRLKLDGESIYVNPKALDEGTPVEPINITH